VLGAVGPELTEFAFSFPTKNLSLRQEIVAEHWTLQVCPNFELQPKCLHRG
jgi:hypothetical protein